MYAGTDLDRTVFRLVETCPPTARDLCSYEALGRAYNRKHFFRGTGISVYETRQRAVENGRRFRHGNAVAELRLDRAGVVWARTGSSGHLTVWAAPETLSSCVIQCERYER